MRFFSIRPGVSHGEWNYTLWISGSIPWDLTSRLIPYLAAGCSVLHCPLSNFVQDQVVITSSLLEGASSTAPPQELISAMYLGQWSSRCDYLGTHCPVAAEDKGSGKITLKQAVARSGFYPAHSEPSQSSVPLLQMKIAYRPSTEDILKTNFPLAVCLQATS